MQNPKEQVVTALKTLRDKIVSDHAAKLNELDKLIAEAGTLFGGAATVSVSAAPAPVPKPISGLNHYPSAPHTIKLGRELPQPITAATLAAVTGRNPANVFSIIYQWKTWGWLVQDGRGKYKRTDKFGIQTGQALEELKKIDALLEEANDRNRSSGRRKRHPWQ